MKTISKSCPIGKMVEWSLKLTTTRDDERAIYSTGFASKYIISHRSGDTRAQDASFTAETSFVHAPLNSRVQKPTNNERERAPPLRDMPLEASMGHTLPELARGTGSFTVDSGLDPALRDLVGRMLPLATHYCSCVGFVEARAHIEFGSVCHALCAAVRSVLKDYTTLITQLEHLFHTSPAFSLQQLWFHVHPVMRTLSLIHSVADDIISPPTASLSPSSSAASDEEEDEEERKKNEELGLGGVKAVLMGLALASKRRGTFKAERDPPASALLRKLLTAASAPYAQILRTWTHHGTLHDPHGEFFVRARVGAGEGVKGGRGTREDYTDEYWERSFVTALTPRILPQLPAPASPSYPLPLLLQPSPSTSCARGSSPRRGLCPSFVGRWKHKVLLAGKYLNVVREWGGDAAGVRIGLKELEDRAKGIAKDSEGDEEGTERAAPASNHPSSITFPASLVLSHSFSGSGPSRTTGPEEPTSFGSAAVVSGVGGVGTNSSTTETMADAPSFREDVKISMASSGLYEWLLKVVSVSGAIDDTGGDGNDEQFAASRSRSKPKDGKDGDKEKKKKPAPALDHLTLDYTVPFPLSLMLGGMWVEQMLGAWRHPVITRAGSGLESRSVSRSESRASHHSGPSSAHPNNPGAQSSLPNSIPNPNHPHTSHYPTALHADFERWRRRVFLLRARMLAFVQQILAFATFEVLEPNWKALEKRLERVSTVDQVLRDHVDFLDTCLKECMLTSAKLLRVYSNLLVTISMFAQYASSFTRSARDVLTALEQEANGEPAARPVDMKKEWSFLNRFEQNFNHSFKVHLDVVSFYASSENVTLLSLVTRLNSVRSMH
ncbi:Spc97 / Spc98 family [Rhizoctonia solani]|uniref:Spindle pole body component n=1 Tax=Rhizoctonia solani TaxID=456999 RepID=A0A8H7M453_9AGAM|nr:Spc97 / Spc98 family [Rhizoctonia solani]